MTERSAEQAPVQTRPDTQDNTARIPLAERLQRRVGAGEERKSNGSNGQVQRESSRVLPPPPPELVEEQAREQQVREQQQREQQAREAREQQARADEARRAEEARRAQESVPMAPVVPAGREAVGASPAAPVPAPTAATTRRTREQRRSARAPRRARLRLSRIDPWSVMKVSFLLAIAFGIVTVVSVFMVWSVLGAAGVWSSINNTVSDTVSSGNQASTFDITNYLGMSRVLGFTMLVSVIDVVLITAIATLGAFLYNMAASLLGGIEVTLAEDQV